MKKLFTTKPRRKFLLGGIFILTLLFGVYQIGLKTSADWNCGENGVWNGIACECDEGYRRPGEGYECEFEDPFIYYGVNLSADPSTGGIVEGAGQYEEGQEASLSATPNTGYMFSGRRWHGDNSRQTDNPFVFEIWDNQEFTAYFTYIGGAASSYIVDIGYEPEYAELLVYNASGSGPFSPGDTVCVFAEAEEPVQGLTFLYRSGTYGLGSEDNEYCFTMPEGNATLIAYYTGIESIDRQAIYNAVYHQLYDIGIYSNLDSVTNENVDSFSNLSFRTDYGTLRLDGTWDLTDSAVQVFLNGLQDNFSMENGYINFTPTGNGSGFNVSATIDFWLEGTPPFIGTGSPADHLIVRDTDNNIMTGEDIDGLFSGDMICNMGEGYYCEFTVNHFTSFELYIPPFDCDNVTDVSVEECEALVDLYNETNGPDREIEGWLQGTEVCEWGGVYCDDGEENSFVYQLELPEFGLDGDIPASLTNLVHLESLDLEYNDITSLPSNIGNLTGLTFLNIRSNELTNLPESLWNLTQLENLSLANNYIKSLPATISNLQNLHQLYLDGNFLTTLPETFASLPNEMLLNLIYNCINTNALAPTVYDYLESLAPYIETTYSWEGRWEYNFQEGNQAQCRYNLIDIDTEEDQIFSGATTIYGRTSTGTTFGGSGDVSIGRNSQHRLKFNTFGLTINVLSGNRDGILYAPTPFTDPELGERNLPDATGSNLTRTIVTTVQAGASGASLSPEGNLFTIKIDMDELLSGKTLYIYRSAFGETWEVNTPDATCTVIATESSFNPQGFNLQGLSEIQYICEFQTDHLSYFTTIEETENEDDGDDTPPSGSNGGGSLITKDNCPTGDLSPSFYDGKCEYSQLVETIAPDVTNSSYSQELNDAYIRAYNLGITTMTPIEKADLEGILTRSHMAKMMVNYAVKVLKLQPDETKTCEFPDIENQPEELQGYIKLACQLGIMGINMENFEPDAIVTRAQFGTILSRVLYGEQYNGGTPYYADHLQALKDAGIMTNINNPERTKELRGWVMLMLMRAAK